jgi:hypothetical protein
MLKFRKGVQESLEWHHTERDPKEIKQSTLPKSENIELHCVWVTEAYTPSNVNGLIKSIKKLGWDKPERSISTGSSLIDRIQETRSVSNRTAWMNAGVVLAPGDARFPVGDKRFAKLPPGVDYCRLSLRNVTSSLTLMTMQFVLTDECGSSLNELMNAQYETKVEYHPSVWRSKNASFSGVIDQKKQAVEEQRNKIHQGLYKWFGRSLPGHYALLDGAAYPTVDLITSRKYVRKEDDDRLRKDGYMDIVFGSVTETWTCKENENLELRLPWLGTGQPIATLFGNYGKLTEGIDVYGGRDRAALTNKLHMDFDATAGVWATHNLLLSYEQGLATVRDRATSRAMSVRKALKDITYIRKQYVALSRDVQAVSSDIATLAGSSRHYSSDTLDFLPPVYLRKASPDFVETLRVQDESRAKQLDVIEARVGKTVLASGDLATAVANIRIQRYVFWLTVIIAIFTLVAIFKH